jgi:hypothetical protein
MHSHKLLLASVATAVIVPLGVAFAPAAGAVASDQFPLEYASSTGGGTSLVQNGTAIIDRAGQSVSLSFSLGSNSAFPSNGQSGVWGYGNQYGGTFGQSGTWDQSLTTLQACALPTSVSSNVAASSAACSKAGGTFYSYTVTGSTASESLTLPSSFGQNEAYLQVQAGTYDQGNGSPAYLNSSIVSPVSTSSLYGNCGLPYVAVSTPSGGTFGLIGAAVLAAVGFGWMTIRRLRRRSPRTA